MSDVIQLPAPGAHYRGRGSRSRVHSRERRQFSVLCWRGWCDHEFKVRSIAALIEGLSGQQWPLPTHLERKDCPTPFTCDCECHDEMRAAMDGAEVTAHAEVTYSRRQGFGPGHAVLDKQVAAGRFTCRQAKRCASLPGSPGECAPAARSSAPRA